ncbi:hypothetical protein EUGRSUZ_A01660 [Eucalyptus grandis]|uniref:Uncharacterized protein n=2 Tax=Eucalyptus grandis TaxID=71139 RepID=A0ACC3M3T2_EUCGR|nr:hypothetical protein EUGRSUZ_A01660 [Eucalyptus grandis]
MMMGQIKVVRSLGEVMSQSKHHIHHPLHRSGHLCRCVRLTKYGPVLQDVRIHWFLYEICHCPFKCLIPYMYM